MKVVVDIPGLHACSAYLIFTAAWNKCLWFELGIDPYQRCHDREPIQTCSMPAARRCRKILYGKHGKHDFQPYVVHCIQFVKPILFSIKLGKTDCRPETSALYGLRAQQIISLKNNEIQGCLEYSVSNDDARVDKTFLTFSEFRYLSVCLFNS